MIITNYNATYESYSALIKENIANIFFKLQNSLNEAEFKLVKIKEDIEERSIRIASADVTVPQFKLLTQKLYDLELRLIENANDLKLFKTQYDNDLLARSSIHAKSESYDSMKSLRSFDDAKIKPDEATFDENVRNPDETNLSLEKNLSKLNLMCFCCKNRKIN